MSERKVEKGQVYRCEKDGVTRTIEITREPIFTKRVGAKEKQFYAVGLSCVTAHQSSPGLVGKKRRVFISVKDLLKAPYTLIASGPTPEGTSISVDAYNRPIPVPVPCGEAESTVVEGFQTVPGL